MGISTVSGPFRSQNGFQELVDGVWTPIGGGGGNAPIVIDRSTSDSIITPAVPTEVGQVYTYFFPNPLTNFGTAVDVRPPLVDGASVVYVEGRTLLYGFSGPPTTVESYGPDTSSANTIRIYGPGTSGILDDYSAFFQFVYMGVSGGTAKYQVLNSAYNTNTFGARIVTVV